MSRIALLTAVRKLAARTAVSFALVAVSTGIAVAQSGTWTFNGGGSWPTTSNWNTLADGSGNTATFSADVPAAPTQYGITLDGNRTIGNITFVDTNTASTNGSWVISAGSGGALTLGVSTGTSTLTTTNVAAVISAVISGSQGLRKSGNGTLFLGGVNTYTGITEIPSSAGTIDILSTEGFGATGSGNHTLLSGGRARIGWNGITYEDFTVSASNSNGAINFGSSQSGVVVTSTVAGQVTLSANARFDTATGCVGTYDRLTLGGHSIQLNIFTGTFAGGGETRIKSPIIGSGAFISNGSGPVILSAANTYSGSTAIMGNATVSLGDGGTGGSIASSSLFYMNTVSATLRVNRSDAVTQGVDFPAISSSGGANIGNFTQAGSGTTILNAANSYKGTTTVDAGALFINGNQSSATGAVTVAVGAKLGGSGTTGGAVTVNGILAPGTSPGVLTVSSLTLASSATSAFEINGTSRGTNFDGLDISTASGLTYGGALSLSFGNGSAFANDTTFDLFSFTGTPSSNFASVTSTGFYAGTWTLASGTWSLTTSEQKLSFTPSTGDLVVAVPEPSTIALLGLAVGGGLLLRRRQRRA